MKKIFSILFFGLAIVSHAQQKQLDSLKYALAPYEKKSGITNDTLQYKILFAIGKIYQVSYPDSAMPWHVKAEALARKWNQTVLVCNAMRQEAWDHNLMGNYREAHAIITKAMKLIDAELKKNPKSLKALRQKALLLCSTGSIYDNLSNYPKALGYYFKSLRIADRLKDKIIMGMAYTDIGIVYDYQKQFEKALAYYQKALEIDRQLNDQQSMADDYLNIGVVYNNTRKFEESLKAFNQALDIYKTSGFTVGKLKAMLNIALTYNDLGNRKLAIQYSFSILDEYLAMGDKRGQAMVLSNLANFYHLDADYKNAVKFHLQALKVVEELGALDLLRATHNGLSEDYSKLGRTAQAFYHYKKATVYRDSIFNSENSRSIMEKEVRFNFDKKAAEDSISHLKESEIRNAEIARKNAELKAKQNLQYALIAGLSLLVVFAVFMYNRYRITQKQKGIIEEQKKIVEEAHKEITDSINYAERLQKSLMASKQQLEQNLPAHFIYFNPKEAVSGDFYWAHRLSNGHFALIAADSTGHGVPGAIMSMMNMNSLKESVKEGLHEPNLILDKTRQIIIETLANDGSAEGGKDGMDCSLLCFNFKNNTMSFALANNPLWLIRNNECIEFAPDKMPVGKHDKQNIPFTRHELSLQKNDLVYIFTDGYADQFGGDKGKKFKYANLKQLLVTMSDQPMDEQKLLLQQTFNQWRGELEQIDDVCIIGIKI